MYDSKKNSGWFVYALKNFRQRIGIGKTRNEIDENNDRQNYTSLNAAKDFSWLKSAAVNDENMAEIMQKIKSTCTYRKKMLDDLSIELLESFPYFFTHPKLVSTPSHHSFVLL